MNRTKSRHAHRLFDEECVGRSRPLCFRMTLLIDQLFQYLYTAHIFKFFASDDRNSTMSAIVTHADEPAKEAPMHIDVQDLTFGYAGREVMHMPSIFLASIKTITNSWNFDEYNSLSFAIWICNWRTAPGVFLLVPTELESKTTIYANIRNNTLVF